MKQSIEIARNMLAFGFSQPQFKAFTLDGVSERVMKGSVLLTVAIMLICTAVVLQIMTSGESAIWQMLNEPYVERALEKAFGFMLFYAFLHLCANLAWNDERYVIYSVVVGLILLLLAFSFPSNILTGLFIVWLAFYVLVPMFETYRS